LTSPGTTLLEAQEARRQRILRATRDLAASGGYEAVQMREVAARAQVALGTLYRYFSSKDHLLATAQVERARRFRSFADQVGGGEGTAADRVVTILRAAHGAFERQPNLAAAFMAARSSPDRAARACHREIGSLVEETLCSALVIGDAELTNADAIARTLGYVWLGALVSWINGNTALSEVGEELERAVRLLVR
jgi:TetR/AcrR family transcriptional regulator, cholesterol catabolism regulator